MVANTTFYLSRILGKRLYSEYGLFLGRILDIVVDIGYKRPKIDLDTNTCFCCPVCGSGNECADGDRHR